MRILVIQVTTRSQWPWIASSGIMFVNYFWCNGYGRNHHDNVHDWITLQRKQCTKEAIIISAKCFIFTSQNSPRTYLPMSVMYLCPGDWISASDDSKINHVSDPPSPNWPHQLQIPSCGPDMSSQRYINAASEYKYICIYMYGFINYNEWL